ncbi:MAG: leucine--tRNA ligase [Bacteroidales bacterium]|jgi:leucyl-tRNA synthetase|nr:leucine--tRNA ligase [Bacteroidales bacterium]
MDYNFREIEAKWQTYWAENKVFKVEIDHTKPKYYVLDMFPYPSGAGLHVGHPLGYIASDIYARYKRLKGFNVLHPMGYDAYGLPAEQYAIQTGQHPAITTEKNIARYREQLDKIGFSFDWDREVQTCDPKYYHWTQWTFIQLFNHWYCLRANAARPISQLVDIFNEQGNGGVRASKSDTPKFTAEEWKAKSEKEQQEILMNYRLAYLSTTLVNWCPKLGTVLANDEVSNGLSVRGGYPVERKPMQQWSLRVSAYAERLLEGLDRIDWSESIKDIQRNWIGKSIGCEMKFKIADHDAVLDIFTTRADTIFGATFMVLCPEHDLIASITTAEQKQAVDDYVKWAKNRSERERQTEVNKVTGVFTGRYAINPLNGQQLPIWIADYVLAGYGTGAIMAVPAHDSRDYKFAKHFDLPIIQVVEGGDISEEAFETKDGTMMNSDFINGMTVKEAIATVVKKVEDMWIGRGKINYRLRDAIFSRQRYWGEPFPIYYKDGMPYALDEKDLPLELPEVDKYLPTESGEPPLARAKNWVNKDGYPLETSTMPGFAGSSAYYLRYMDAQNATSLVSSEANKYWQNVDLYIGGSEHATGHLIYARFWNKFLFDIGVACKDEPFQKLINQGMIQGRSNFVYRVVGTNQFVSYNLRNDYEVQPLHVDINIVDNDVLDTEKFKQWMPDFAEAEFILEDGKYICGHEVEKMSKSMYNVQNPDDLVEKYGADTLRMYEMFLGPLEQSKPWDTQGIEGVFRFLRKAWRLYHPNDGDFNVSDETPTAEELKILHKTIRKIEDDTERFAFNTAISTFMIAVNELSDLKCNKRAILEPLAILLASYTPHIAEELWSKCRGAINRTLTKTHSIAFAQYPQFEEKYVIENMFTYPVSFNGKTRFMLELPIDMPNADIEKAILAHEDAQKWLNGNAPKKVIIVPKKIVNIVV